MAVKNQPAHGRFCKGGCANDWPQLLSPDFACCLSMALFSHALEPGPQLLFVPHSKILPYATFWGADVMRRPSRAQTIWCPTTIPPQPVTNSVMSGRVFLKQVPALLPLHEAAVAEARDAPSTNQQLGWIEKKCGPACESILRVCVGEIERVS
jgi:hypothetical protein